jgi:putative toxin-antitoxin system antitoxin component (TIGR02293 family)
MAEKKTPLKKTNAGRSRPAAVAEPLAPYEATVKTLEYLGGRSSVLAGMKIVEEKDFITLIKKGIPRKSLDQLLIATGLTAAEIAAIMHTSDRTLRRYKPSTLLNPEQSERVVEIARLYSRGAEVMGNAENFKEWMNASLTSLGGRTPKEFLDTSMGIEILMDTLGRIEQGVFS